MNTLFTQAQNRIIRTCAIECRLQGSGEESVFNMVEAWDAATQLAGQPLTKEIVEELGFLVEPLKNRRGFRECGVRVGGWIAPGWTFVPSLIEEWIAETGQRSADLSFKEFEEIHPFVDGNGRTGLILFNWLNGSLLWPVWPTNWFKDYRRTKGYGA